MTNPLDKYVGTVSNDPTKTVTVQTGGPLGLWFYRIERPGPTVAYTSGWFMDVADAMAMAEAWHESYGGVPDPEWDWNKLSPGDAGYDEILNEPEPCLNGG